MRNDPLQAIEKQYPQLARYLQNLNCGTGWQGYETAKRHINGYPLSAREHDDCVRYIVQQLKL